MFQPNFVTFTNTHIVRRDPMGGDFKGNQNEGLNFVQFSDGSGGVEKLMKDWIGNKTGRLYRAEILASQEYLASRVGEVMNAPIRDCLFTSPDAKTIVMPFIHGQSGEECGKDECYPEDAQGGNLRLFDYLTANADRRPKNLMFTSHGIVGIDHALCNFRPREATPEVVSFLWNRGLTIDALLALRPKLKALQGIFHQLSMDDKHQNLLDNLDRLIKAFQIVSQFAVVEKGDVAGHDFHGNQWEKVGYSSHKEYQQKAAKAIKDYVSTGHITIKMPMKALRSVVRDGRLKNAYEVYGVTPAGDSRSDLETRFFGHTDSSPVSERPIYGYIDHEGVQDDPNGYGEVRITLKDDVKDRSTVTIGDSNATFGDNKPEQYAWTSRPLSATDPNPDDISQIPTKKGYDIFQALQEASTSGTNHSFDTVPYIETQIHGGVSLKDIASIDFGQTPPSPTMASKLDRLGIAYTVSKSVVEKGDVEGHVFHGNQYENAFMTGDTSITKDAFTPPQGVQEAAKRALEWIADGKAGSGFTPVGRKRASDLGNGHAVSLDTLKRMKAYFDRHQPDKKAEGFRQGEHGYPSHGRVAWDAWGGDAGYSWAKSMVARHIQKGDVQGHEFHGNQWEVGDGQAKELANLYFGVFRYDPQGLEYLGSPSKEDLVRKSAFAYELNKRMGGETLGAGDNVKWKDLNGTYVEPIPLSDAQVQQAKQDANDFMKVVSERSAPVANEVERGLVLDRLSGAKDAFMERFAEGKTVDLPLSSWANQKGTGFGENADQWANRYGRNPNEAVYLHAPAGTIGTQFSALDPEHVGAQFLTGGRFVVDRVDFRANGTHIYLTQKQFYAKSRDWKTADPNYLPKWFPSDFNVSDYANALLQASGSSQVVKSVSKAAGDIWARFALRPLQKATKPKEEHLSDKAVKLLAQEQEAHEAGDDDKASQLHYQVLNEVYK
jgi:hypothetical protein